jgi:CBS domain-containing protein
MLFTVRDLIEGHPRPVSVQPSDTIQKTVALMIEHDFSQLPVVDGGNRPLGMVTSDSIVRALTNFGVTVDVLHVRDAMVPAVKRWPGDNMFDLLDALRDTYAVLVIYQEDDWSQHFPNEDNGERLMGIFTSYDAMEYFRSRTEDVMLVEDVESALKEHIRATFARSYSDVDEEALQAACPNKKTFERLSFGEYAEMLLRQWPQYGKSFDISPDALRKLLNGVRETRNALAHFRGEISPGQQDQLHFCVNWFDNHPPIYPIVVPEGYVSPFDGIPRQHEEPESVSRQAVSPIQPVIPEPYQSGQPSAIVSQNEPRKSTDNRYAPLAQWLQQQPIDADRTRVTFEQIEGIINGELPASARKHRAWWANDTTSHTHSQQWLDAGWRVAEVSIPREEVIFSRAGERQRMYIEFFNDLLRDLRKIASFHVKEHSPQGQNWYTVTGLPDAGPQLALLGFSFAQGDRFRAELYIDSGDKERNKQVFDQLLSRHAEIEAEIGEALGWERIDDKRACRIALYHDGSITDDPEELASLRKWAIEAMLRFQKAIGEKANMALKSA